MAGRTRVLASSIHEALGRLNNKKPRSDLCDMVLPQEEGEDFYHVVHSIGRTFRTCFLHDGGHLLQNRRLGKEMMNHRLQTSNPLV